MIGSCGSRVRAASALVILVVCAGATRSGAQCPTPSPEGIFAPSPGDLIGPSSEFRASFPLTSDQIVAILRADDGTERSLSSTFGAENVLVPSGPLPVGQNVTFISRNLSCDPVEACDSAGSTFRVVEAAGEEPPVVKLVEAKIMHFSELFAPCYSASSFFEGASSDTPYLRLTFSDLGENAVKFRPEAVVRRRDPALGVTLVARENAPVPFIAEAPGMWVRLEEFNGQAEVTAEVTLVGLDGQRGATTSETFVIDTGCAGSSCRDGSGSSTTPVVVGCMWLMRRRRKRGGTAGEVRQTLRTSDDTERP